ncbi:acyl-CoA thioesterase [Gordonia shandongensis]|uniref:acyl-CoA thioesterase n=1 Tax=Gordonia shandongensis TaxID=376351 RepID=UPI000428F22B|nr:thioesterase family protein [Gordonia shandongensis]
MTASPFTIDIQLRWGDMDSLAHVNNVQFARLLEEARVRAWHVWFSDSGAEDSPTLPILVARQEIEFVAPLYYGVEPVRIEMWVPRIGTKSFDYGYRIATHDGQIAALAETTCTVIDPSSGRPAAIPEGSRAILEDYAGDEVPFRRRR